ALTCCKSWTVSAQNWYSLTASPAQSTRSTDGISARTRRNACGSACMSEIRAIFTRYSIEQYHDENARMVSAPSSVLTRCATGGMPLYRHRLEQRLFFWPRLRPRGALIRHSECCRLVRRIRQEQDHDGRRLVHFAYGDLLDAVALNAKPFEIRR